MMRFSARLVICFSVSAVLAGPAAARDWLVPEQAPTIQAAVDSCVAGDVVVIAPGTYDDCTHLNGNNVLHIAILKPGVSLRGASGDPDDVILDAGRLGRCLELRNATGAVTIEALTLRRGRAVNPFGSGGGAFVYNSTPAFRSCVFDSCHADFAGGGIAASTGSLTVIDCVLKDCSTPNIGGALRTSNAPLTVTGTTLFRTVGAGIHYAGAAPTLGNCLIVGGDAASIARNTTSDPLPTITCSDFFDNDVDWPDFIAAKLGQDGNLSQEPYFCNPLFGDLHLYSISPCAAENNAECGQIGALPVGCGLGASTYLIRPDGTGDFPTIQEAINAAADGDTLLLADGVFTGPGNRDLELQGKAVTLRGASLDPDLAVIDCQGSTLDPHRGFHLHQGETLTTRLSHLTVRGGNVAGDGAGMLIESSPWIADCVLTDNHAARGAGVFCDGGSPQLTRCEFTANEGRSQGGGAACFGSNARLEDCLFTGNWGYQGGALFLPDSSAVRMIGCTLSGNNSSPDKEAVGIAGRSSLAIERTLITFNNRRAVRRYDLASFTLIGSDVYGNAEGDFTGDLAGLGDDDGNLSADPLYCEAAARDFHLRADSPCTPASSPNQTLIGAFAVGCGSPSRFADLSPALPGRLARSRGATWTDYDGDGRLDFFVANDGAENEVLRGGGDGTFTVLADPLAGYPGRTLLGLFGDWNHDGLADLYLGNSGEANLLGANTGGGFNYVAEPLVMNTGAAGGSAWTDYDSDGRLDLFLAVADGPGKLLRGDGTGAFQDQTTYLMPMLGACQQAAWADMDGDGDRDVYLVRDGLTNILLRNDGVFSDQSGAVVNNAGAGRGAAWGDHDNDGDLDLYLVNHAAGNRLYRNGGSGTFVDATAGALGDTGPGRSGIWGDWDNDGDLDLFLANCGTRDRLLRNEGSGFFVDVQDSAFAAADSSTGAAWGDLDRDGDLDLLIADQGGATRLWRNTQATGNHWLTVDLVDQHGGTACLGARVRVVTGGRSQLRELGAGGGWLSLDEPVAHFGLGTATVIDTLRVRWPSGHKLLRTGVSVDQRLVLSEGDASAVPGPAAVPVCRLLPCRPNPFNPVTTAVFELTAPRRVELAVYDLAGRRVRALRDEVFPAGRHEVPWRGRDDNQRALAAGVYFLLLRSEGVVGVERVMLVK